MQSRYVSDRPAGIKNSLLSVHEALEVFAGKWKIPILLDLACGRKRFSEIKNRIKGLSSKILSKELKQLEEHCLIKKNYCKEDGFHYYSMIHNNCPTIEKIIDGLREWGDYHRSKIFQRHIHTSSIRKFVYHARKSGFDKDIISKACPNKKIRSQGKSRIAVA